MRDFNISTDLFPSLKACGFFLLSLKVYGAKLSEASQEKLYLLVITSLSPSYKIRQGLFLICPLRKHVFNYFVVFLH